MHRIAIPALVLALSGPCLLAQAPQPTPLALPANIEVGCGLQTMDDGTLLALGTDYKATFAAGQLTFTPMLGMAAPHDLPLGMTVAGVGRGELQTVGLAQTHAYELRVDCVRPQLTERFDVRPEGLEQSFVFAQLPVGSGDLVVRVALTSELRAEQTESVTSMRFTYPGAGGVEIAQVVGIDALGHRATGQLRQHGAFLDFVLPAAFVDTAKLPLVLDPLIAPIVVVNNAANDDRQPDIAHLPAPTDLYLVVWRRMVSATNGDIHGQRVTTGGVVTGSLTGLETGAANASTPCVGAQISTAQWLVIWQQAGDVMGVRVTPTGAGGVVGLANGANNQVDPDIADGQFAGSNDLVVVWRDATADAIVGRAVDMAANPPAPRSPVTLVSDASSFTEVSAPAVSRNNHTTDWMLTYVVTSSVLGTRSVRGLVRQGNLAAVGSSFAIAGGSTEAFDPAVAGDGSSWLVAYATDSQIVGPGMSAVSVRNSQAAVEIGTPRSFGSLGSSVRNPSVAWGGNSALVAYTRSNGTQNDVLVTSVDPFTCLDCEGTAVVDLGGNDNAVVVSPHYGDPDASAIVWVPEASTSNGNVSLRRYIAEHGDRLVLSSGCATGRAHATCARLGNGGFALQLRGATPGLPAFALLAANELNFSCGPCLVVPDFPNGYIASLGNTSTTGDARAALPLPNDSSLHGAMLRCQFALPGNGCLGSFVVTEAIRVSLQ